MWSGLVKCRTVKCREAQYRLVKFGSVSSSLV